MAGKEATKKRYTAIPAEPKAALKKAAAQAESAVAIATATLAPAAVEPKKAEKPVEASTPTAAKPAAPVAAAPAPAIVISELLTALHHTDADLAREAAASLGASRNVAAVEPLIAAVRNADGYFHSVVRAAASAALAQIGDARAVDVLIAAIGDPMAEASAEAVRALAVIGGDRAIPALLATVKNADGYYLAVVRRAAVVALGQIGGVLATAELRSVAIDPTEDTAVRAAAQEATATK